MATRVYAARYRNSDFIYIPKPIYPQVDGATAPRMNLEKGEPNYDKAENGLFFRRAIRDMLSAFSILIHGKK
jgi:hypothetical protein